MRLLSLPLSALVALAVATGTALGAPAGTLDPGFNTTGVRTDQFDLGAPPPFSYYDAVIVGADARLRAVASNADADTLSKIAVRALTANGAPDTSWAGTGLSRIPAFSQLDPADVPYHLVTDAARAPDGSLVVVGWGGVDDFNMRDFGFVQRYRPDGTPDPAFGTGGTVTFSVPTAATATEAVFSGVAVDSTGRIIVVGQDRTGGRALLVRFLPNGQLDTSLAGTGYLAEQYDTVPPLGSFWGEIEIAADGSYVLLGGAADQIVAKLTPAGALDPGFGTGGQAKIPELSTSSTGLKKTGARALALQPDGRIVVGGSVSWRQGIAPDYDIFESWVGRLTAAGTLDPTFDGDGIARWRFGEDGPGTWANSSIDDLQVQENGRIVAAGITGTSDGDKVVGDGLVIRLRPDGSFDVRFGTGGQVRLKLAAPGRNTLLRRVILAPGRRILVAGGFQDAATGTAAGAARLIGDGEPTAALSAPAQVKAGTAAQLDASASADDWAIASYSWDLNGDGTFGDATGPTAAPQLGIGVHTVAVRVTDDAAQTAQAAAKLTVTVPFVVKLPKTLKLLGASVKLPISCAAPGPCQGTISLMLKVKTKLARTVSVRVGGAPFSLKGGQRRLVKIRVAQRVRRNVARNGKSTVTAVVRGKGIAETLQRSLLVIRR